MEQYARGYGCDYWTGEGSIDIDAFKAQIREASPEIYNQLDAPLRLDWEFAYVDRVWRDFDEFFAYTECIYDKEWININEYLAFTECAFDDDCVYDDGCNTKTYKNGSASLLVTSLVTMLTAACMFSI